MPAPYIDLNGFKIAPFKYGSNAPYGAFINTTKAGDYSIKQNVTFFNNQPMTFVWPSAEHAYHAQKIIHLIEKFKDARMYPILLDALRKMETTKAKPGQEFSPRDDWDPLVVDLTRSHPQLFGRDKDAFFALCDSNYHSIHAPKAGLMPNRESYTLMFMRNVLDLKLQQYPQLKQLAKECAREGILPIEVSQYDWNWATGLDGTGSNMLGWVILELGNKYLKLEEPTVPLKITNPKDHYEQCKKQNGVQLAHNMLTPYTSTMKAWNMGIPASNLEYYYSGGGNKRLVLENNKIVGYEYRKDITSPWLISSDLSQYTQLVHQFKQNPSPPKTEYFMIDGGNMRLVFQNNRILGYEFRKDAAQPWEISSDIKRYQDLISRFQADKTYRQAQQQVRQVETKEAPMIGQEKAQKQREVQTKKAQEAVQKAVVNETKSDASNLSLRDIKNFSLTVVFGDGSSDYGRDVVPGENIFNYLSTMKQYIKPSDKYEYTITFNDLSPNINENLNSIIQAIHKYRPDDAILPKIMFNSITAPIIEEILEEEGATQEEKNKAMPLINTTKLSKIEAEPYRKEGEANVGMLKNKETKYNPSFKPKESRNKNELNPNDSKMMRQNDEKQFKSTLSPEHYTKYINELRSITLTYKDSLKSIPENQPIFTILDKLMGQLSKGPTEATIRGYYHILEKEPKEGEKNLQIIEKNTERSTARFLAGIALIAATLMTGIIPGLIAMAVVYKLTDKTPMTFFKPLTENFKEDTAKLKKDLKSEIDTVNKPKGM